MSWWDNPLQRPSDFGLNPTHPRYAQLFKTWALGPVIETRDSTILEQSNAAHLLESLEDFLDEWEVTHCNHWAVGWVDHLTFHAVKDDGSETEVFKFIKSWFLRLDEQPIADEEDYSERWRKGCYKNIKDAAGKYVTDHADDEEWPGLVYDWLMKNEPGELESRDMNAAYPSVKVLREAIKELKLLDASDEEYEEEEEEDDELEEDEELEDDELENVEELDDD